MTGRALSPVSSTSPIEGHRSRRPVAAGSAIGEPVPVDSHPPSRFRLVPERSVALIEARSTVGPITFGAIGVIGTIEVGLQNGSVRPERPPTAHIEIKVDDLRSGNRLYDAELHRRIDARRHPTVTLDLRDCRPAGVPNRYRLAGDMKLHGVSRPLQGTVSVTTTSNNRLVISGEEVLDIRDFDIASPTVLMLRIYPDVRVQLHVEAELED